MQFNFRRILTRASYRKILADKIRYSAQAPWPVAAAGGSNSLQLIAAANYGIDPVNWRATAPTAGRANAGS